MPVSVPMPQAISFALALRIEAAVTVCSFVLVLCVITGSAWAQNGPVDPSVVFKHGFERGAVKIDDLSIADCVVLADDDTFVENVKIASCHGPHDFEVFATYEVGDPSDPYPGNGELVRSGYLDCQAHFENYVGVGFWDSVYDITTITPSPSTWSDGDREVVCLIVDIDGAPLTGPARGSQR